MNEHPEPGRPWQGPGNGPAGWGLPPGPHGGGLDPYTPSTGGYMPAEGATPLPGEPTLLTIGDIAVTQNTVITPAGRFPIKGTVWTVTDMSRAEQHTPTWAIVVAILVFWWTCLLGLLFLLVKETRVNGHVQVTVQGAGHHHSTLVPVSNRVIVTQVNHQVNHARSLAA
ncbi:MULTISPECIES: hypothetical protein [Nocardiopsis]|uniref:Uncharacterized protein n=2 Tax=Nocardiopsis alba TaxID=53437 RepID=A0A7K2IP91_9ACTN|nr:MULTISPECIES: hypothetical protein [Nocardiopsis]AFR09934.1 hypothetical protein B005_0548 [Nocardiopsis alba ATCC BAA-2165]MEC3894032.1 hypothetical protein [Nocardiopsis sp. LDBS1602]MYR31647.1 hypothetical protein [Nocardiopsis alba]